MFFTFSCVWSYSDPFSVLHYFQCFTFLRVFVHPCQCSHTLQCFYICAARLAWRGILQRRVAGLVWVEILRPCVAAFDLSNNLNTEFCMLYMGRGNCDPYLDRLQTYTLHSHPSTVIIDCLWGKGWNTKFHYAYTMPLLYRPLTKTNGTTLGNMTAPH